MCSSHHTGTTITLLHVPSLTSYSYNLCRMLWYAGTQALVHVTLVLNWLWLWVEFKLVVLVHQVFNSLAPQYLTRHCQLVTATVHHQLRSSDNCKCSILRRHLHLGKCAFTGLQMWNSFLIHIHQSDFFLVQFYESLNALSVEIPELSDSFF